ncbi:MAG: transposase [Candidatus Binatia bacterium]
MAGFDYSQPGGYFVTVVVDDRKCVFGTVTGGGFELSSSGEIVHEQWQWIAKQYPYVAPDEFVVMPNHVHGIISIVDLPVDNPPAKSDVGAARERPVLVPAPPLDAAPLHRNVKTLSELIGAFKTTSAKRIHDAGLKSFQWQRSFYERIIRSEQEAHRIREYIQTNPLLWELDIENPQVSMPGRAGRDRPLQPTASQGYYDEIIAPK